MYAVLFSFVKKGLSNSMQYNICDKLTIKNPKLCFGFKIFRI